MMKKLLTAAVLVASFTAAHAQFSIAKMKRQTLESTEMNVLTPSNTQAMRTSSTALANDTLWYYYNKQKFINTAGVDQLFYTAQASVGTSTNGDFVEFGSSFLNAGAGAPVTINGAVILVSRQSNSSANGIPIRLYVYNATNAGVPTTKVDSADATITNTNGQFNIINFASPKTVTGSFFISYRTMPNANTDTLLAWLTGAATPTLAGGQQSWKYGESLSFTRGVIVPTPTLNMFFSNTNFLFGTGSDVEAVVMPIVSYSINPNYTVSAGTATNPVGSYCTNSAVNFTNTTNPNSLVYNRQFNFNRFITYWKPLTNFNYTVVPNAADPIDNWSFTNGASVTTFTTTNAATTPTTVGTLTASLTIKFRHSPFQPGGQYASMSDVKTTTYNVVSCTSSVVGIAEVSSSFETVSIYPNPTVNGKTTISGLNGNNTILVYDMLGQLVGTQASDKEVVSVDLANKANGNYIVKIINSNNDVKVVKIINQN